MRVTSNWLRRVVREPEVNTYRRLQMRGPLPSAVEAEATVPADDDVLEVISSDEECGSSEEYEIVS